LGARDVIVVDLNSIFFPYLKERFSGDLSKIRFYNTSGYELNGIESGSIDFVFTFGTFVHIEPEGILAYLAEINRVLKPKGTAVMQYADKTKKRARELNGFTDMNPTKMESFITEYQFELVEHNIRLLNHSNIAVVRKN
jgi:ubiquinone/menaquinone biosynthesis C-methylase UbiE